MISDDTLMGTRLMTFLQETGWFGQGILLHCNRSVQDILSAHNTRETFPPPILIKSLCFSVKVKDHEAIKQFFSLSLWKVTYTHMHTRHIVKQKPLVLKRKIRNARVVHHS